MLRVFTAVYNDAWKRCSVEHELEMLPLLLRIARQAQLLGISWGAAAEQRFKDCSRFELRFDSKVTFDGTWPLGGEELYNVPHTGHGTWRAQATTINSLGGNSGTDQVSLPLTTATYHDEYTYRRSDDSTCHGYSDQTGSTPGTLRTTVLPSFNPPTRGRSRRTAPGPRPRWTCSSTLAPSGVIDKRHTVDCGGSDYTNELTSEWLVTLRTSTLPT